jgi:ribonuclease G
VLVQVIKEPIGTKGAKLTTQISIAGRFLVLVPDADFIGVSKQTSDFKKRRRLKQLIAQIKPPGVGFIVRTIGLKVSEAEFVSEIHMLVDAWRKASEEALKGSGTKLVYRELGITTGSSGTSSPKTSAKSMWTRKTITGKSRAISTHCRPTSANG